MSLAQGIRHWSQVKVQVRDVNGKDAVLVEVSQVFGECFTGQQMCWDRVSRERVEDEQVEILL